METHTAGARAAARSAFKWGKPVRRIVSPDDELRRWLDQYEPVEREIIVAREKRAENRRIRARERMRRFGDLCEATEGLAKAWRRRGASCEEQLEWAAGDWWTMRCLLRYWRMAATRELDALRHEAKRPLHYTAENARRGMLAAERRRVMRRTTENPCPTREEILEAWIHVKDSHEAMIRFGGLIEDLECYLDNSLRKTPDGVIVGRNGGVKRWLQVEIPALYLRYTTVMRYKIAAKKLRQLADARDPVPVSRVLDAAAGSAQAQPRLDSAGGGDDPGLADAAWRERSAALWRAVTDDLHAGATPLMARLDALLEAKECAFAERATKNREDEITVRTKSCFRQRPWFRGRAKRE